MRRRWPQEKAGILKPTQVLSPLEIRKRSLFGSGISLALLERRTTNFQGKSFLPASTLASGAWRDSAAYPNLKRLIESISA